MHWIEIFSAGNILLDKIPAIQGQLLYAILQRQGIHFPHSCQGLGKCKHCRVVVQEKGSALKHKVLSCQYQVQTSLKVYLPYLPQITDSRKKNNRSCLKTLYRFSRVPLPRENIPGGLDQYLKLKTRKKLKHSPFFYHTLPRDFYTHSHITLSTTSRHIWSGDKNRKYIIFCDFGTTTVTCRKVSVDSGAQETFHFPNPQLIYGADILSRINHLMEKSASRNSFISINRDFFSRIFISMNTPPDRILAIIIAGNSVMEYILRGFSPDSLGVHPFLLSWGGDEWSYDQDLLWYYFPLAAGFIGGDLIAGLYGIHAEKETDFLFIDIGTNGEIALGHKGTILTCSCAAGPALEGGNIENAGPAIPGAVSGLSSDQFSTIAHKDPIFFCGSGLIDFIWGAYKEGILGNDGGIIKHQSTHYRVSEDAVIHKALPQLPIRQKEIRHFQSAKAAFWSGVKILLEDCSLAENPPSKIYVGGGFSYALNIEALKGLHFFPKELFSRRILASSQPVMEGLERFYLSLNKSPEKTLQRIVSNIKPLELAGHPKFEKYFMQGMFLKADENY